jgi:hypothetical protein
LFIAENVRNNDGHGFCRGWTLLHLLAAAFLFFRRFFLNKYNLIRAIQKAKTAFFVRNEAIFCENHFLETEYIIFEITLLKIDFF